MSEASYLTELRDAAPDAPIRLRELVHALPADSARRPIRFRPALAAVAGITLAIALSAAALGGLSGSRSGSSSNSSSRSGIQFAPDPAREARAPKALLYATGAQAAPTLTAKSRLQRQDVSMSLRVKDLSAATQRAVGTTRRLGGFVAAADYSTDTNAGYSSLVVRVPVANLQQAIASFTQLGAILSQHISVTDLQGGVDRLDKRIATARRAGNDSKAKQLLRKRAALVREGTYAKVSLQLTTTKPVAQPAAPSRFDRFWDNTKDILGKELIAVLYALVIAGPFILLAALLVLGERTRRRRADHRLLEEAG